MKIIAGLSSSLVVTYSTGTVSGIHRAILYMNDKPLAFCTTWLCNNMVLYIVEQTSGASKGTTICKYIKKTLALRIYFQNIQLTGKLCIFMGCVHALVPTRKKLLRAQGKPSPALSRGSHVIVYRSRFTSS
jgi:hypothetical protein